MKIRPGMEEQYQQGYNYNLDPYGHGVYMFLERWANLLEAEIEKTGDPEKAIIENAYDLASKADEEGITGFMYGCAVSILSRCWEYGEILRKWHNKEYDYGGDGVVNPAILTIK